jgi:hypothetical protein
LGIRITRNGDIDELLIIMEHIIYSFASYETFRATKQESPEVQEKSLVFSDAHEKRGLEIENAIRDLGQARLKIIRVGDGDASREIGSCGNVERL